MLLSSCANKRFISKLFKNHIIIEEINIIEVKATTAKKYLDLKENNYSIWKKKKNVVLLNR